MEESRKSDRRNNRPPPRAPLLASRRRAAPGREPRSGASPDAPSEGGTKTAPPTPALPAPRRAAPPARCAASWRASRAGLLRHPCRCCDHPHHLVEAGEVHRGPQFRVEEQAVRLAGDVDGRADARSLREEAVAAGGDQQVAFLK